MTYMGIPLITLTMHKLCVGTIALSANLADSLEALYNARIPKDWLKKSWEAATLGNWFLGLLQRHDQLHKWLTTGRPRAFWLTGFFNPQVHKTKIPTKCVLVDLTDLGMCNGQLHKWLTAGRLCYSANKDSSALMNT